MKIFITGIAGFLGSHLADRFIKLGHTVSGNDTLIGGYIDNVNPKATLYEVNCCDREKMLEITKGVDIVVHAAATAHEGLSVFSPDFITKNIFKQKSRKAIQKTTVKRTCKRDSSRKRMRHICFY